MNAHLVTKPGLYSFEHIIRGRFVSRKTKSSVTTVFIRDLIQVPEVAFEARFISHCSVSRGESDSLDLFNGSLDPFGSQKLVAEGLRCEENHGDGCKSLHNECLKAK